MLNIPMSVIYLLVSSIVYFLCTKIIFDNVFLTSKVVVDEEFHLPIGEAYCKFQYDKWDPKITTLPGLYLITSFILGPIKQCSIYYLRFMNVIASVVNVYLFYFLLRIYNNEPPWKNILSAINLAILPPLYFFNHVYYTDVISLTFILLMLLFHEKKNHYVASLFGFCSVIMRQTNIIWVLMVTSKLIIEQVFCCSKECNSKKSIPIEGKDLGALLRHPVHSLRSLLIKSDFKFWLNILSYFSILISFAVFIYLNGSIVVGDKTAHKATMHLPQIFYFFLFTAFFTWPFFITEVFEALKFLQKYLTTSIIILLVSILIVHHNTLVHPYMLADNRHFIFYIWQRFYGKMESFRYLMTLSYIFAFYVVVKKLWCENDVSFALSYFICTTLCLVMQKLIEFRYFLIPFVLFRLKLRNVNTESITLEFLTHIVVNFITLHIFFERELQWNNYDYPQRIMW